MTYALALASVNPALKGTESIKVHDGFHLSIMSKN